jgi:hypothetical protein
VRIRFAAVLVAGLIAVAGCSGEGGNADQPAPPTTARAVTTPPTTPSAAATAPSPRTFTFVATGDVLPHEPLWEQARRDAGGTGYDFGPLFTGLEPLVEDADLALCHLETPVGPAGGPYRAYPTFSVPPQVVRAIAGTGYDACTTASNHTLDQGTAGIGRTLDALDGAGIAHTGSARTTKEAHRPLLLEAGGARIAVLSYTYGFNGFRLPAGRSWAANLIEQRRILADARDARRAGADVVVVALHWGVEYVHKPTAQQRQLAPRLLGSPDIDLLVGHHAHAVQPVERIGDEWVAYGLGNSIAAHSVQRRANTEGLLVRFTFTERAGRWRVTKAEFAPTYVRNAAPFRLVDLGRALADPGTPRDLRAEYQRSYDAVREIAESRGGDRDGLQAVRP